MKAMFKRMGKLAAFAAGCVALTGCFLVPGNFDAAMDLRADGSFSYSYDGEIQLLGLKQLAAMKNDRSPGFEEMAVESSCYDWVDQETGEKIPRRSPSIRRQTAVEEAAAEVEAAAEAEADAIEEPRVAPPPNVMIAMEQPKTKRVERPCTEEEIAEREERAEAARKRREERDLREAEKMQAVFGGIDPTDPEAGQKIAERLSRQNGWDRVEYRGDGLFVVSFSIKSRLEHDFAFPTMEGFQSVQPFLVAYRREDSMVRIDAPGFVGGANRQGGSSPYLLAMIGAFGNDREAEALSESLPTQGTFTLTTDGEVLANNTDGGFTTDPRGKRLVWKVDRLNTTAPTALIRLR